MILEQFYLEQLSQASYLIGDEETGVAAIVDPRRDVDLYVNEAKKRDLRIVHVLLTHFHADFVSGHLELAKRTGAPIYVGARGNAEYDFVPLHDGDRIEFGRVRLEILETPGHTPECVSILVYDLAADEREPHAVLTGDTLFNGDVGRPDLMASVGLSAHELAGMMYDSLHDKLLKLPDEVIVYPGHGAGSACGKNMCAETWTTIGAQRAQNYALQPMSKQEFVRSITEGQPPAPRYFAHDAMLNRTARPTLDENLDHVLVALSLEDLLMFQKRGAIVLDVRDSERFASGHLAGSLNIPLGGRFCSWAGTVLDPTHQFAIVADLNKHVEAAVRLGRVGFDNIAGYLAGGALSLGQRPALIRQTVLLTAESLTGALASDDPPVVIDVRTLDEWRSSHIDGSHNIPLNELKQRIDEVPLDRSVVVHCQTGYRSAIAASLMRQHGGLDVADLIGGIVAWQEAGRPTIET